jgi:hypothetical protein
MAESASDSKKRHGGLTHEEAPVSAVRLPVDLTRAIDVWATKNKINTRAEAIQRLVELGIAVKRPAGRRSETQRARAKEMAGNAIDSLTDATAHPDDKATRKRRLLRGPEEFRDTLIDRSKKGGT